MNKPMALERRFRITMPTMKKSRFGREPHMAVYQSQTSDTKLLLSGGL